MSLISVIFSICPWHCVLGKVEQAHAEPGQIRGYLVHNKSRVSISYQPLQYWSLASPSHPCSLSVISAFTMMQTCRCGCTSNGVAVLRRSPPTAPDLPSGADSHISDALSGTGTLTTWLRQRTGRYSSLPGTLFAVGAQSGGITRWPSATVRPHLWCIGDNALAERPRMHAVQNCNANFQSAPWQRATISWTSCHLRWSALSASSVVSKYQPSSHAAH